jgi:hypothetical protein
MKRAAKVTALILFVSLLTGCTSSEEKACEAALSTHNSLEQEIDRDTKAVEGELKEQDTVLYEYVLSQLPINRKRLLLVIVNNQACFTPFEVANAQIDLEKM